MTVGAGSTGEASEERSVSPVLARPVVIGASVSEGAAAQHDSGGVVDLAVALDSWIVARHEPCRLFASGTTFLDPVAETKRQIESAMSARPSVVFALDTTFWPLSASASTEGERLARLDATLAALSSIEVPLILGDIPDRDEASSTLLSARQIAASESRAEANRRIYDWAKARSNVIVLPLGDLVRRVAAGEELTIRGERLTGNATREMLAPDRLHATAKGVVALAGAALDVLIERGLVAPEAVRSSYAVALAQVAPRAPVGGVLAPGHEGEDDAQGVDPGLAIEEMIAVKALIRNGDPAAVPRGVAFMKTVPARSGLVCEDTLARDLAAMSEEARVEITALLSASGLRATSATASDSDTALWTFVAVGLKDRDAMRAAAKAYRERIAREGKRFPRSVVQRRLADSAYEALLGVDESAAGEFWSDPKSTALRWDREEAEMTANLRAVGLRREPPKNEAMARVMAARTPAARAAKLATCLRAAGRMDEADAVEDLTLSSVDSQ